MAYVGFWTEKSYAYKETYWLDEVARWPDPALCFLHT